jgi:hypothetical protein
MVKFKHFSSLSAANAGVPFDLSSLSVAKDLLLASVGTPACASKQQVLPVGQDDKFCGEAGPSRWSG